MTTAVKTAKHNSVVEKVKIGKNNTCGVDDPIGSMIDHEFAVKMKKWRRLGNCKEGHVVNVGE